MTTLQEVQTVVDKMAPKLAADKDLAAYNRQRFLDLEAKPNAAPDEVQNALSVWITSDALMRGRLSVLLELADRLPGLRLPTELALVNGDLSELESDLK